jgi:hypothetical protein
MRFRSVFILSAATLLISVGTQARAADSDGDGIRNALDNCKLDYNPGQEDEDLDLIGDACDNCTCVGNPGQVDANNDGFGNRCDPDLNDDMIVGGPDVGIIWQCFNMPGGRVTSHRCKISDLDTNGTVDAADVLIWENYFAMPPGPSAMYPDECPL